MSRGDRSREDTQRTSEERERDREERERRRALRSGRALDSEETPAAATVSDTVSLAEPEDGSLTAQPAAEQESHTPPEAHPEPPTPLEEPQAPVALQAPSEPEVPALPEVHPEPEVPALPEVHPEPEVPLDEAQQHALPEVYPELEETQEHMLPEVDAAPEASEEPESAGQPETYPETGLDGEPALTDAQPAPEDLHPEIEEAQPALREELDQEIVESPPSPGLAPPRARGGGRVARAQADRAPAPGRQPASPLVAGGRLRSRRSPLARLAAVVALLAAVAAVILVAKALHGESTVKAPPAPAAVKVLIPEGKTRAQIALIAAKAGLKGSYRVASRRSSLLDPAHYGAPHGTPDLEGFLFPATYDMNPGDPASRLVAKQLLAFRENFGRGEIDAAHALNVTPYQVLIVASMIEREAQVPGDRAKIAAVIYNRLHAGMPIGIDASIYYAVELAKRIATYTHELTESDLHINSPYNTRTHTGLPPTPISNPGVASIQAAAHPAHASYLYYVAGADGCGEQVFSTSQAAFEANAAAYQAAVRKNGGNPPSCKHH